MYGQSDLPELQKELEKAEELARKDGNSLVHESVTEEEISKIMHPEEGMFTDFDNLSDPSVEGF